MDQLSNKAADINLPPIKIVILPSTFQGSPRSLLQNYQDAMAMIAKFGKPDLVLTFMCNLNWREISENLHDGEIPINCPDLLARVFQVKTEGTIGRHHHISCAWQSGSRSSWYRISKTWTATLPHIDSPASW